MVTVSLKNAFEISKEELRNSEIDFIPHNPKMSKQYKKWMDKDRIWKKHLKQKEMQNLMQSDKN